MMDFLCSLPNWLLIIGIVIMLVIEVILLKMVLG